MSKPVETDIVVSSFLPDEPDKWFWAFAVDGKPIDYGLATSEDEAYEQGRLAREKWEHRNNS